MNRMPMIGASLVVVLCIVGSSAGETLPKEGSFDFTACWSGVTNTLVFDSSHSVMTWELLGTDLSNPPGGILDKSSFRCVGMRTTDAKTTVSNYCEVLLPRGQRQDAISRLHHA